MLSSAHHWSNSCENHLVMDMWYELCALANLRVWVVSKYNPWLEINPGKVLMEQAKGMQNVVFLWSQKALLGHQFKPKGASTEVGLLTATCIAAGGRSLTAVRLLRPLAVDEAAASTSYAARTAASIARTHRSTSKRGAAVLAAASCSRAPRSHRPPHCDSAWDALVEAKELLVAAPAAVEARMAIWT